MISFITFIFVMVVTAVLFGSWVVVSIGRFGWRLIAGITPPPALPMTGRQCENPACQCGNPMHANFCRRCGSNLMQPVPPAYLVQQPTRFDPSNNPASGRGRQVAHI